MRCEVSRREFRNSLIQGQGDPGTEGGIHAGSERDAMRVGAVIAAGAMLVLRAMPVIAIGGQAQILVAVLSLIRGLMGEGAGLGLVMDGSVAQRSIDGLEGRAHDQGHKGREGQPSMEVREHQTGKSSSQRLRRQSITRGDVLVSRFFSLLPAGSGRGTSPTAAWTTAQAVSAPSFRSFVLSVIRIMSSQLNAARADPYRVRLLSSQRLQPSPRCTLESLRNWPQADLASAAVVFDQIPTLNCRQPRRRTALSARLSITPAVPPIRSG